MTPQIKRHFNTAARFLTVCILASSMSAHAQTSTDNTATTNSADACPLLFDAAASGINDDGQYGWRFSPNTSTARAALESQTFFFVHAQEHLLITDTDEILVKFPKTSNHQSAETFPIVRITPIKTGRYRPALGDFIEIVGQAEMDRASDIIALPSTDDTVVTPLRITHAYREIFPTDKILTRASICHDTAMGPTSSPVTIADNATAHSTALLNHHMMGVEKTVFTIDKGLNQGVQVGQTWRLLDTLAKGTNTAKPFGEAQVVQVFDEMSVLIVNEAAHEVLVDTLLQIKAPAP